MIIWIPWVSGSPNIPWHKNYLVHSRFISEDILPLFRETLAKINRAQGLNYDDPEIAFQVFHTKLVDAYLFSTNC